MQDDFNLINEAKLWDDLKFKADKVLMEIESIKDLKERVDAFDKPRFALIQELLKDVGKEFFKLFLFKAIQKGLKENADIEKIVNDFQFFFWPGFTTLKGKRIFSEGALKPNTSIQRYFSGVGNNSLKFSSLENVTRYLKKTTDTFSPKKIISDTDESSFWVFNIPSTLAFDAVLNQFYFDENPDISDKPYQTASSHQWKASQRIPLPNGSFRSMPMTLSKDLSEFRILEVMLKEDLNNANIRGGNSAIKIEIPSQQLNQIGSLISAKLNYETLPINFKSYERQYFVKWPQVQPAFNPVKYGLTYDNVYHLQTLSYSFWLSETLSNKIKPIQDYGYIRKAFKDLGYNAISEKIQPFSERLRQQSIKDEFAEFYYNNWYTLYLDSYGDSVDLGTATFLTSETYDTDFLTKCSSWLRWIYYELRLLEGKAREETKGNVEQQEEDFGKLAHNTKVIFPFLKNRINSLNQQNFEMLKDTVLSEITDLENIIKASFYSNDFEEFKKKYPEERIDIKLMFDKIIEQISFDIKTNNGDLIKLPNNKQFLSCLIDAINSATDPLFKINSDFGNSVQIIGNSGILHVIFKDLLGNAAKWSTSQLKPGTPYPRVEINLRRDPRNEDMLIFECVNSQFMNKFAIEIWKNGVIPKDSNLNGCLGLKIASDYCKIFKIPKTVRTSSETNKTTFTLKLKLWISSE